MTLSRWITSGDDDLCLSNHLMNAVGDRSQIASLLPLFFRPHSKAGEGGGAHRGGHLFVEAAL